MATADLLDLVVQTAYTGQAWAELQRRLVKRAFPDLERAVRSGAIYRRVRAGRLPAPKKWAEPVGLGADVFTVVIGSR